MTLQGRIRISTLNLRHTGDAWAFAAREKERIEAHWQRIASVNPALWNGQVLMCHDVQLEDGCLAGRFLTTDFASFVAWRDWSWPDRSVRNCFGSAVVLSNDGALIYGRMSEATLNAGKVYPPGGSLEPMDIRADGSVDVQGSIERELEEETGLKAGESEAGEWVAIFDGLRLCLAKAYRFDAPANLLADRARRHLEQAAEEELAGVEIIRARSQIDSRMPTYAAEVVRHFLPD